MPLICVMKKVCSWVGTYWLGIRIPNLYKTGKLHLPLGFKLVPTLGENMTRKRIIVISYSLESCLYILYNLNRFLRDYYFVHSSF